MGVAGIAAWGDVRNTMPAAHDCLVSGVLIVNELRARIWHLAKPLQENVCHEAEEIWIEVRLPFVPVPGMLLRAAPGGEVLRIKDVYWDIDAADVIEVFTAEPDRLPAMRAMLGQGWHCGNTGEAG